MHKHWRRVLGTGTAEALHLRSTEAGGKVGCTWFESWRLEKTSRHTTKELLAWESQEFNSRKTCQQEKKKGGGGDKHREDLPTCSVPGECSAAARLFKLVSVPAMPLAPSLLHSLM